MAGEAGRRIWQLAQESWRGLSPAGRRTLAALIVAGVAARTVLAFATYGPTFDMGSYVLVGNQLSAHVLHVYSAVNVPIIRWPYPSGYFPWLRVAIFLNSHTPLPFHGVVQLPPIAADAALAFVAQGYLGLRGAGERTRLLGAGLVTVGPAFAAVSGYQGQIDSLAILPAVVALVLWEQPEIKNRAVAAGLLIGAGTALKTFPIFMLLALLPTAGSKREAALLVAAAAAVPLIVMAPFVLADPSGTEVVGRFTGVPGLGGLSLLVQPGAAEQWITEGVPHHLNGLNEALLHAGRWVLVAGLGVLTILMLRRRLDALHAAVIVWLAVLVLSANFGARYVVWALPVLIMAGYLRAAALIQVVATPLIVIVYGLPFDSSAPVYVYIPLAVALWAGMAVALVRASAVNLHVAQPRSMVQPEP